MNELHLITLLAVVAGMLEVVTHVLKARQADQEASRG